MNLTLRLFFPLALATLVACNTDPPAEDDGGGGQGGEPNEATLSAKKVIGTEGGSIAIDGAALDFPPGALTGDQEITVSRLDEADVSPLPAGAAFASPPVAFEPHGLGFDAPVTVNLDYNGGVDKRFVVAKLDDENDETWEKGADAEFEDGKATFTINGFSVWAVVDDAEGAFDETGTGGTGGGTGGTGGTGGSGGTQSGPGSFSTNRLSGLVTLEDETGAITTTNVGTATALPYCAAGSAPADLGGAASVGLEFDLGENGTTDEDYTPGGDGLFVDFGETGEAELAITLHTTEGGEYCFRSYFSGRQFIVWEHFGENCNYETGPVYDPATETIDSVTMLAVPYSESARPFAFCVEDIDDGYNGYLETADFHGFVSGYQTGDATISYGPEDSHPSMGACVAGNSSEGALGLVMNLAQTVDGEVSEVEPTGEGLELDLYLYDYFGSGDPWVYISDGTTEWCAPFPYDAGAAEVPYFIAWSSFNTDCYGSGTAYGGQALRTLKIIRGGSASSFNLCLYDALDTTAPVVGYFTTGPWHGYPEVTVSGTGFSVESNLAWERSTANACMWGSVDPGTTDSVTLLAPIDQDTPGGTKNSVTITGDSLEYQTDWLSSATDDARAVIIADDAADGDTDYCATLVGVYPETIAWDSFVDCDTGAPFLETSVKEIGIRIKSDAVVTTYFDFCMATIADVTN